MRFLWHVILKHACAHALSTIMRARSPTIAASAPPPLPSPRLLLLHRQSQLPLLAARRPPMPPLGPYCVHALHAQAYFVVWAQTRKERKDAPPPLPVVSPLSALNGSPPRVTDDGRRVMLDPLEMPADDSVRSWRRHRPPHCWRLCWRVPWRLHCR